MSSRAPPTPQQPAPHHHGRMFKACRNCRRQKMKCLGTSEAPCPRCEKAGVECVFDQVGRRKRALRDDQSHWKARCHELENELARLMPNPTPEDRPDNAGLGDGTRVANHSSRSPHDHPDGFEHAGSASIASRDEPNVQRDWEPRHLHAPVTAVNAMSPTSPSTGCDLGPPPTTFEGNQAVTSTGHTPGSTWEQSDLISSVFTTDGLPRLLFACYMNSGNAFLPLFDPSVDTFDSLRQRSVFCLITVLYISLKQDYEMIRSVSDTPDLGSLRARCLTEARRLALESLFSNPATLASVKAMILLAAHAGKTWFAIGHALQMAMDLRLDSSVSDLIAAPDSSLCSDGLGLKFGERARTWLILTHVDQEVAYGTARRPRTPSVQTRDLRRLTDLRTCATLDLRFLSTIDIVQIRGTFQKRIEGLQLADNTQVMAVIQDSDKQLQAAFQFWDQSLSVRGLEPNCFLRSSLWIQRNYAMLNIWCSLLHKLHDERTTKDPKAVDIVVAKLSNVLQLQIRYILHSPSYRWHFRWAPTFSATMLTFLAVLAIQLSHKWPQLFNVGQILTDAISIVALLKSHPHAMFAFQVENLLKSASIQNPTASTHDHVQGSDIQMNTDDALGRQFPFNPADNAMTEALFDSSRFVPFDWSFDSLDLSTAELW